MEVAHPGVSNDFGDNARKYYTYYQWVCFVLFFQVGAGLSLSAISPHTRATSARQGTPRSLRSLLFLPVRPSADSRLSFILRPRDTCEGDLDPDTLARRDSRVEKKKKLAEVTNTLCYSKLLYELVKNM